MTATLIITQAAPQPPQAWAHHRRQARRRRRLGQTIQAQQAAEAPADHDADPLGRRRAELGRRVVQHLAGVQLVSGSGRRSAAVCLWCSSMLLRFVPSGCWCTGGMLAVASDASSIAVSVCPFLLLLLTSVLACPANPLSHRALT